jgi:Cytochrome P460
VKSLIVGRDHESFSKRGGIHHYYANDKAVAGYRTGIFPDGSIVVDEAVFMKDGEGRTKGLLFEGERRFLDVMVKDGQRYRSTGGWGARPRPVASGGLHRRLCGCRAKESPPWSRLRGGFQETDVNPAPTRRPPRQP